MNVYVLVSRLSRSQPLSYGQYIYIYIKWRWFSLNRLSSLCVPFPFHVCKMKYVYRAPVCTAYVPPVLTSARGSIRKYTRFHKLNSCSSAMARGGFLIYAKQTATKKKLWYCEKKFDRKSCSIKYFSTRGSIFSTMGFCDVVRLNYCNLFCFPPVFCMF